MLLLIRQEVIFSLCMFVHTCGGYPARSRQGGRVLNQIQMGDTRVPPRSGRGVPCWGGGTQVPPKVRAGGYPARGTWGWGTLPGTPRGQDGGYPARGVPRTAHGVLDTPQSVCLLHSRRRTFLFIFHCTVSSHCVWGSPFCQVFSVARNVCLAAFD